MKKSLFMFFKQRMLHFAGLFVVVQVSDTRNDDSSNTVKSKKLFNQHRYLDSASLCHSLLLHSCVATAR